MELKDTVVLMESSNYEDRFRAEYYQLENRIHGLEAMLIRYKEDTLPFTPKCAYEQLFEQLLRMKDYKMVLQSRAFIEQIQL